MHSLSEFGSNVPAFLAKLWKLVDDPDTNDLISWSEEGTSFFIRDQAQFSRKLLPMYYKHNNMASFIRQLNMYGFHKIVSTDAGSLRLDKDEMEFAHQCFLRGHPYLLEHIKRKVGKNQFLNIKILDEGQESSDGGVLVKAEFMNKVLTEVKNMRGRQDTVESRLTSMKQENEALWRELSLLRQKHIKQQTIVNKLIQFLVTLVQPSQRLSSKRRYPLMIDNIAHPTEKVNGKLSNINLDLSGQEPLIVFPTSQNLPMRSPFGTTIHELDGDTILPDSGPDDLLSNSINLDVSGSELSEIIDSELEPEVLSAGADVLDSLSSANISSVPLLSTVAPAVSPLEVNSPEGAALDADVFRMDSPSPEALLTVCPSDLNPAIVVPALRAGKKDQSESLVLQGASAPPKNTAQGIDTASLKSSGSRKRGSTVSKVVTSSAAPAASSGSVLTPKSGLVSEGPKSRTANMGLMSVNKLVSGTSGSKNSNNGLTISMNKSGLMSGTSGLRNASSGLVTPMKSEFVPRASKSQDALKELMTSVKGQQPAKTTLLSSAKGIPSIRVNSKAQLSSKPRSKEAPVAPYPVTETKKELRVLLPVNRRKKQSNGKDALVPTISEVSDPVGPLDLFAEAGIDTSEVDPLAVDVPSDGAMVNGTALSCPSPIVAFPTAESPIPVIHSPAASPSYSTAGSSPMSAMSSDATSPLVVFPMSEPGANQEMTSPQMSPIDRGQSPHVADLTLACTPQAGPSASPSLKPVLDRSETASGVAHHSQHELDHHLGSLDSELSQLKELFNSSGLQFDANTLLGLFSGEDISSLGVPIADSDAFNQSSQNDPQGNELTYYQPDQPDFMDLNDFWNQERRSTPPASPINIQSELNTPVATPAGAGFGFASAKRRKV